ncbi:MAG: hypothetical protein ACI9HK_000253, partial [Pirellulaceae bacterium]
MVSSVSSETRIRRLVLCIAHETTDQNLLKTVVKNKFHTIHSQLAAPVLVVVSAITFVFGSKTAVAESPRASVQQGIAAYRAGDFQTAGEAFEKGQQVSPEDSRIIFDLGCTAAAKKDWDEAVTLLRKATFAETAEIVAKAHYNLGGVATDRAKSIFGRPAEDAAESARNDGMVQIDAAIRHYRDCLATDASHPQARRNLELLRIWSKFIREAWDEKDRQKRREEMDLGKYLDWLQTEQRRLRQNAQHLSTRPSSPKQRYAVGQMTNDQTLLAAEIPFLQRKIQAEVNKAAAGQGVDKNQLAQSLGYLNSLTSRAREKMVLAGAELEKQNATGAVINQTAALDPLNDLFLALSPFETILQQAIQRQQKLVKLSAEKQTGESPVHSQTNSSSPADPEETQIDVAEQARRQNRISKWARALAAKADQALEQLPAEVVGPTPEPDSNDAQQAQQMAAARAMCQKA